MTSSTARRQAIADEVEQLRRMIEMREVEDGLNALYSQGAIRGSIHTGQGQEAVAVAAAAVSQPGDFMAATYRGHGAALAFGVTPLAVIAEVLGRSVGSVQGLGGSMHLADRHVNVLPTTAIVGAGLPIAAGTALNAQLTGSGAVSIVFFGDGSTNIGAFHETLNLAALWNLPLVFVCENNLYGEYSPIARTTANVDLLLRARPFDIPATSVDGQDLAGMRPVFDQAFGAARAGEGPQFIEAKTYRFHGHSRSDPANYRPQDEVAHWRARDPLEIYAAVLTGAGRVSPEAVQQMRADVAREVAEAIQEALAAPPPEAAVMFSHVVAGDTQH